MALFFLTPGQIRTPEGLMRPGGSLFRQRLIPMTVAALVDDRPNGDVTLVDAGFSRRELEDPRRGLAFPFSWTLGLRGSGADAVASQLEARGIAASRVKTIVATHLHLDHIGAFVDFPNAEVVAPAIEFASGKMRGRLRGYTHVEPLLRSGRARPFAWDLPTPDSRSGDPPPVPAGRFGFPCHRDLFGDARVILLDARGHTAGSCAVLLNDPGSGQRVLMAGDAAYDPSEYRRGVPSLLMRLTGWSESAIRASWGCLDAFESEFPEIRVVCAHDPAALGHLPHA